MLARILPLYLALAGAVGAAELTFIHKGSRDPFASRFDGYEMRIDFSSGAMEFQVRDSGQVRKETLQHAALIHAHVKKLLAAMKREPVEKVNEAEPHYVIGWSDGGMKTEWVFGELLVMDAQRLPRGALQDETILKTRLSDGEHHAAHVNAIMLATLLHEIMGGYFLETRKASGIEYPAYFSESGKTEMPPDFTAESYVDHFKAMGEEPLPPRAKNKGEHLYRWTCLRTFHNGFCVTLEVRADGSGLLTCKMESGKGGYEAGSLIQTTEMNVPKAGVADFLGSVKAAKFWTQPKEDPAQGGLDGSHWIIEGIKDGTYHVTDRWTPEKGAFSHELGTSLLKMACWTIENLY